MIEPHRKITIEVDLHQGERSIVIDAKTNVVDECTRAFDCIDNERGFFRDVIRDNVGLIHRALSTGECVRLRVTSQVFLTRADLPEEELKKL